jgi:hypothetical protein
LDEAAIDAPAKSFDFGEYASAQDGCIRATVFFLTSLTCGSYYVRIDRQMRIWPDENIVPGKAFPGVRARRRAINRSFRNEISISPATAWHGFERSSVVKIRSPEMEVIRDQL